MQAAEDHAAEVQRLEELAAQRELKLQEGATQKQDTCTGSNKDDIQRSLSADMLMGSHVHRSQAVASWLQVLSCVEVPAKQRSAVCIL